MAQKRFYLSTNDRVIGGVCGGLAEYFGIDSMLIRIIVLFFALCVGSGLLFYLILWMLFPKQSQI